MGDIESRISSELVITPSMWEERYGLKHGAAFGLSHGLGQLAALRPSNTDSKVWLSGGGWVGTQIVGAQIVGAQKCG